MKKKNEIPSWKETFTLSYRALKLLYHHYPEMILSRFGYSIWCSLAPYAGIYFSAAIVEELMGAQSPERLKKLVLAALLTGAIVSLIKALLERWKKIHSAGIYGKLSWIYSKKMLTMDYASLDQTKTSELLDAIRQCTQGGGWGLMYVLVVSELLIGSLGSLAGGIGMTISLFTSKVPEKTGIAVFLNHPFSAAVVIFLLILVAFLSSKFNNKSVSYWSLNADVHRLGNRLWEYYASLGQTREVATDIRIYRQDRDAEKHLRNKEATFASKGIFAAYAKGPMGVYAGMAAAVSYIFTGVAYLFVCLKAWAGAFGLGAVTRYIASVTTTAEAMTSIFGKAGAFRTNVKFLQILFEFMDIPNEMYQGSLTVEKRSDRNYEVEFCNVSFKYPGSQEYALKNVNMKFEIGKRMAVVGMNGSGKTTFIKLLCRLYDPTEGEILLNGIDIKKYNYAEYMNLFSVVFQDFQLFALQLGENVASDVRYDREKVLDCLKKAGFEDRLEKMEKGLDSYLYKDYEEEGIDISGGEAQKIAIARALYKDAPFMILDEPTAALDPMAEAEIYSKFDEIAGDRTSVYISHRLSSCKFCDEILVFHHGTVIQQGSHEQLVTDQQGKYYELWNAQAQYYTE